VPPPKLRLAGGRLTVSDLRRAVRGFEELLAHVDIVEMLSGLAPRVGLAELLPLVATTQCISLSLPLRHWAPS